MQQFSIALALLVQEMEAHPFSDRLGPFYQEVSPKSSQQSRGEFYTPECVSELMARMMFDAEAEIDKGRPVTVSDPCSGSGGLVLAIAKQFAPKSEGEKSHVDLLRVSLVDISPTACDMAYVNMTLWGIPARVMRGNTLSNEMNAGWKNIHWARVGEDERLKAEAKASQFMSIVEKLERDRGGKSASTDGLADIQINRDGDQVTFDFGI